MDVLESRVDTRSEAYRENAQHMASHVATLHERLAVARAGGGEEAVARHVKRGKLVVRERIEKLLDPESPFLEFSPLAAWDMYDNAAVAAGIVTGIGRVQGS